MDYYKATESLIKLLCVSIESLSIDQVKKLVTKRYKQWHPDKNPNDPEKYREQFMLLKQCFDVWKKGPPDSGAFSADDLFCDEEWDETWETDSNDSEYNSTPFDDEFFNASPKKNFAVPDELRLFFRSKTNRRAGKLFMIFSFQDSLHLKCLENLSKGMFKSFAVFSGRTNKEIYCTLVYTENEYRLMDLKKLCRKFSLLNIEVFYSVNKKRLFEKLIEMYGEPVYTWNTPFEKPPAEEINFSQQQLTEFAISIQQTNVMILMYEYAHLAGSCDRSNITKEHDDDHINEKVNAKKFLKLNDRYKACSSAVKCVNADLCGKLHLVSNTRWFENRSREFSDRLSDDCSTIFGEAYYYWRYIIGKETFYRIISPIIAVFTGSECKVFKDTKRRYVVLRGVFNCGKTTLAAAICKFFDGVNININVGRDRLPFYLGSAIGKRFVLFDDVKGYKSKSGSETLPTGNGLSNLDDIREHLDGIIEVQLEKKNQNTVNQIFPSGLITMNNYKLPKSLKVRLRVIDMVPNAWYVKHRYRITMDTIFIMMALDNLIPCDKDCLAYIVQQKNTWMQEHRAQCTCIQSMVSYGNRGKFSFSYCN